MADTLGFIGLGQMGLPIALNLQSAGFAVQAFNRTPGKAQALIDKGATLANSAVEVASAGGVVITMLTDDNALDAVATDDLAKAIGAGGVHISMSTVSPDINERLAERFAKFGVTTVAAPVFGRPEAAQAGKLWVCLSGPAPTKAKIKPILDAIGQGTFDFGEAIGAANIVKLAGNFMLTAAIETMAEASALAEKNGIPRESLLKFFASTLFNCPIYNNYSTRIINADYEKVGFPVQLALKDMLLARGAAVASSTPMPYLDTLCDRYVTAIANGRKGLDASALALGAGDDAGLKWL